MLQIAAGFLRLLYQESILPQTKTNITVKILEDIAKRNAGIEGIRSLQKALPIFIGVNVVGLTDATQTIKAWLKSVERRPFGVQLAF